MARYFIGKTVSQHNLPGHFTGKDEKPIRKNTLLNPDKLIAPTPYIYVAKDIFFPYP